MEMTHAPVVVGRAGESFMEMTHARVVVRYDCTHNPKRTEKGGRIIYGDDPCPRGGEFLSELTVLITPSGQEGRENHLWRCHARVVVNSFQS